MSALRTYIRIESIRGNHMIVFLRWKAAEFGDESSHSNNYDGAKNINVHGPEEHLRAT